MLFTKSGCVDCCGQEYCYDWLHKNFFNFFHLIIKRSKKMENEMLQLAGAEVSEQKTALFSAVLNFYVGETIT